MFESYNSQHDVKQAPRAGLAMGQITRFEAAVLKEETADLSRDGASKNQAGVTQVLSFR